jgi:hypothetical protein
LLEGETVTYIDVAMVIVGALAVAWIVWIFRG